VQATPGAVRLVQEQGGQLYVWAKRSRCCHGSLTFLETSSEPRERPFRRVDADEIELYLDQSLGNPEELVIEAKGTSPQARARVLGRLRKRRLAVAPTRARGKADEQQRKRLGRSRRTRPSASINAKRRKSGSDRLIKGVERATPRPLRAARAYGVSTLISSREWLVSQAEP
jgi:hypothetical protein